MKPMKDRKCCDCIHDIKGECTAPVPEQIVQIFKVANTYKIGLNYAPNCNCYEERGEKNA